MIKLHKQNELIYNGKRAWVVWSCCRVIYMAIYRGEFIALEVKTIGTTHSIGGPGDLPEIDDALVAVSRWDG